MTDAEDATNRIRLTGVVVDSPDVRRSPAGVPIARLLLDHESTQTEAGVARSVRFRIGIRASGEGPAADAVGLRAGQRVTVEGFLARIRLKPEDNRLIVNAMHIQRMDDPAGND